MWALLPPCLWDKVPFNPLQALANLEVQLKPTADADEVGHAHELGKLFPARAAHGDSPSPEPS